MKQVSWRFVVRERVAQLLGRPRRRRMVVTATVEAIGERLQPHNPRNAYGVLSRRRMASAPTPQTIRRRR
jgi:hypothetical protein